MSTRLNALQDVLQPVLQRLAAAVVRAVPIESARGVTLAEPLRGAVPVPPRAIALRSGFAVASLDLAGASSHAPIMLPRLPPVVTEGDALPGDCDAVIDPAALTEAGRIILATDTAAPALNARLA